MAGGPPSSIDIGEDSSFSSSSGASGPPSFIDIGNSSGSSSYWEQRFYGGDDPSAFIPEYTQTDKALALFRLGFGVCFIVLGTFALVRFFRSRWILDIRTRSVHLVMIAGVCVLLTQLVAINQAVNVIWDSGLRWFWSSLVLFFVSPALFGSYICRALRLAVVFHPRAKRALPWLIPERNHIAVLLAASMGMLAIPIYHEYTLEFWEVIPKQTTILEWESIVLAVVLACIYPFIRNVDDLFSISTELIIVTIAIVLLSIVKKVAYEWGGVYEERWLGNNASSFFAAVLFGVSVVDPLRRLAFDPLAASKRNYADRVLLSRRKFHSTVGTASGVSSGIGGDSEDEARLEEGREARTRGKDTQAAPAAAEDAGNGDGDAAVVAAAHTGNCAATATAEVTSIVAPWARRSGTTANDSSSVSNDDGSRNRRVIPTMREMERVRSRRRGRGGGGGSLGDTEAMEVWDFERLARTPLLAAAFEDYSRKALCHESVVFLSEVARYQNGDYATPTTAGQSQFGLFCYITNTFIKAGSIEEVNISDADKRPIVELYRKGEAGFEGTSEEQRRMVFRRAYVEVKAMLEANLLQRFLQTERFKNARMQRENIQAMMDSPSLVVPPPVG